jgi:hypothetical protein
MKMKNHPKPLQQGEDKGRCCNHPRYRQKNEQHDLLRLLRDSVHPHNSSNPSGRDNVGIDLQREVVQ